MTVVGHCFFAERPVVGGEAPTYCWGPLQRAHLIPKPWLYRELELAEVPRPRARRIVWNERIWVPSCWGHHQAFDHFRIVLARPELPPVVEEYAAEHGVLHLLDRRYDR